jgi:hypothetical protein
MAGRRSNKVHFSNREKLELLKQVLSHSAAFNLMNEIDSFTFKELRELRDILGTFARGKTKYGN